MEKKIFNEISLEGSGLYSTYPKPPSFKLAFDRYNITNIGQILDDDLMNEIMQHCKKTTIRSLRNFIEVVKYKYLGIPLSTNDVLDKKYKDLPFDELANCFYSFNLAKPVRYNKRMDWEYLIKDFIDKKEEEINNDKQKLELIARETSPNEYLKLEILIHNKVREFENLKIIDIIKEIVKRADHATYKWHSTTIETFKLQIKSYEQSKKLEQQINQEGTQNNDKLSSQEEHVTLVILRDQLFKLINMRDNLNTQIEDLQQKINELSKTNTEGGANK